MEEKLTVKEEEEETGPKGVGGWLLIFCIGLTILAPLGTLAKILSELETAGPVLSEIPGGIQILGFENAGRIAILIYGFVIGCRIWGGSSQGRRLAKQYLVVRLFGVIGYESVTLILLSGMLGETIAWCARDIAVVVICESLLFTVWWLYFRISKRVRNTYGAVQTREVSLAGEGA